VIARIGRSLGLNRAGLAHGLRLAFAAWLAFAIASLLHVGNAYWAAMPIWVVAQASRGLLLERAVLRFLGTVLGAAVGFGLLRLTDDPRLLLALLGLWVAANSAATQLLRGVLAYGALMSGMTAAVVILPSVLAPGHSAAVALARVECTLIGVVVVTLVTGLWTPVSPRQAFFRDVRRLASDAVGFVAAVLEGAPPEEADAGEQRILREMGEVQATASRVTAGSVEGYRRLHHVDALVTASLAVMAAGRALDQRLRREGGLAGPLADDLASLADLLRRTEPRDAGAQRALLSRIERHDARLAHALDRLIRAEAAFGMEPGRADARSFGSKASYLAPHHDARLAAETGLATGAATFLAALLGYVSGWPMGELAALGVCIFSMVLGSLPMPRAVAPLMLLGVGIGVVTALFYRLAIQPHVTTIPALLLSIAPFILLGGLARASRRTAGPALDANMCFLLASQAVLPPVTDRVVILNEAAALMLAAGLVCPVVMALPRRVGRRAEAAMEAIHRDLLRMARQRAPEDPARREASAARQILRLSLHLGQMTGLRMPPRFSLLAVLNLGEAIARLQGLLTRHDLDGATRQVLSEVPAMLRCMREDPAGIAREIEHRARALDDRAAAEVLRDAAAGLRASQALLTLSIDPASASTLP
jgi:uncharacterized membrane protein YccC